MRKLCRFNVSSPTVIVSVVLSIALVIGLVRLRCVSRVEPEFWSTATGSLVDETFGELFDTSSISTRLPIDQFAFWNPSIKRVLAEHPDDAALHTAAALIYDKPSDGMHQRAFEVALNSTNGTWKAAEVTFETSRRWNGQYDSLATPLAMEQIHRTVELESENPQWLRLKLALSVRPQLYPTESVPRPRDLALAAIAKPHLRIGEPGYQGLVRLHSLARHPQRGRLDSRPRLRLVKRTTMVVL